MFANDAETASWAHQKKWRGYVETCTFVPCNVFLSHMGCDFFLHQVAGMTAQGNSCGSGWVLDLVTKVDPPGIPTQKQN